MSDQTNCPHCGAAFIESEAYALVSGEWEYYCGSKFDRDTNFPAEISELCRTRAKTNSLRAENECLRNHLEAETIRERCEKCGNAWKPSLIESGECVFCTVNALRLKNALLKEALRWIMDKADSDAAFDMPRGILVDIGIKAKEAL